MGKRNRKRCICIRIGALSGKNTPQPAQKAINDAHATENISTKVAGWINTGRISTDPVKVRQALSDLVHFVPLQKKTIWHIIHEIRKRLAQMTMQAA